MADEFIKGFALFSIGALGWFTFGGWYRTPSYYEIVQLVNPPEGVNTAYGEIGVLAGEASFWLMIVGALTFWVIVPASRELRDALNDEGDADAAS
ncbi:hypothetical protein GJ633_13340 [Halorubrum sp. CBA1125]|uniref:DUF7314 family protein n=1 Tax=Halorubrum sp. CBA1125 TaxID=2668072 RepID=UPI0012E8F67E|nr:hypothetical protein [Halorubrum sp. CBA1125]MUW15502.1 hypothetical protein [Halorubrum sp. CBA1125]